MKIHLLNCGSCAVICERLFVRKGTWFSRGRINIQCLLVESTAGLILIDTGLGQADLKRLERRRAWLLRLLFKPVTDASITAKSQILAMGFDPADVRHIVMTHMDYDHAGGLSDFPNAKVHLSLDEYQSVTRRSTLLQKLRYDPRQIAHQPNFVTHEHCSETWMELPVLQASTQLPAAIKLVSLSGHTTGHCGVAIQLAASHATQDESQDGQGDRWAFHVGDAVLHHGELSVPAHCPAGMWLMRVFTRAKRSLWKQSLTSLRRIAQQHPPTVQFINTHDPAMQTIDE